MGKINILDKNVAEKIAAGEVVERPASIVKELVENSIDALATSITVEIEKGGTEYIRVTDNGAGIEKDDTKAAFLRHATSKIKSEEDLESIGTLGFRGEALCSVSAVSRTELLTRTAAEDVGTYMVVEGGETKEFRSAGCPLGTTVTVRNVFFNTPARMKFLKKDSTEAAYVTDICQRAALSHPEVSFRYIRDGKDIFFTPGDNVLKNTIRAVFGKDISNSVISVKEKSDCYIITGECGKNNLSRPNRNMQYFFVNGRLVKSALLSAALSEAYKNELMIGKFPVCMLNIEMPGNMVDVNVHPAKTEVKFAFEEDVYRAVVMAVKSAVVNETKRDGMLKERKNAFKTAVESPNAIQEVFKKARIITPAEKAVQIVKTEKKTGEIKKFFNPIEPKKGTVSAPEELPARQIERLEEKKEAESSFVKEAYVREDCNLDEKKEEADRAPALQAEIPDFRIIGQLFSTYILLESGDEFILIDQHAAHERINYEKIKNAGCMKQTVMLPITVNLTPREKAVWEENKDFFDKNGFEGDDFGQDSIIIRTLPSDIEYEDGEPLLIEIIGSFMKEDKGEISYLRDRAVYTIACRAAIKANKKLSVPEMEALANSVFEMEGISTCPHGRPIKVKLTKYQIEKMFKRIV